MNLKKFNIKKLICVVVGHHWEDIILDDGENERENAKLCLRCNKCFTEDGDEIVVEGEPYLEKIDGE